MKIDFLLIGGGLAGTALGYRLIQSGKTIRILDLPEKNQSSRIAAGLYNPVTGRKMVKTWLADQLFPEIEPFYREIEKKTGASFLRPETIYRPFISIEEQNEWMGNSSDEVFIPYIKELVTESQSSHLQDPYGGVMLRQSGWLDIPAFLDAFKKKFSDNFSIENFEESMLQFENGNWHYGDIETPSVVFCNGVHAAQTSFFGFLPFAPVKGEILELKQEFCPEYIVNRGVFRVHLGDGIHRVGSTYTWHDLDIGPTERAKNELLERLQGLVNLPVEEVVSHKFGIRPATKDRKPFLGKHPSLSGVYIFNGFGAKGVSLVPYFSNMMNAYLLNEEPVMKEVDIARYFDYI
ncbi:FAD-dependent oxidoreductase [Algoriphagus kandeliae]|uniref:FAD-dependent oxidoreductase n=1 Tax=Algoriphagus kandeliae TaxID=2562278 RepID=A0A4Y9QTA8_9BACT|nr:FAD-dependent oxidoreductase [Algoriphagus kandeliae]TFV94396.1 FAD-dependent oxidoreductase [Algoriphagus kandeliae]